MAAKKKWTILIFIAAQNNLQAFGKESLYQILKAGSSDEVCLGAYFDSAPGAAKYVMGGSGAVAEQEVLGEADSGDPSEVIKTAKWLFEKNPAERYGLILWSHGTGWQPEEIERIAKKARPARSRGAGEARERSATPGAATFFRTSVERLMKPETERQRAILFDDGSGHSLDTIELAKVTSAIKTGIGQRLDFLGMDACLMGNIEVAYELRESVRTLVASPELVPAKSWPYTSLFIALKKNAAMPAVDLAKTAVAEYLEYYRKNPPAGGDVTKVAVDLSKIGPVKEALDQLAEALLKNMGGNANLLWGAQRRTLTNETKKNTRKPNKFDFHLWDLGSTAQELMKANGLSLEVMKAAQGLSAALKPGAGAIISEGHVGQWFDQTAGLSIYLIMPGAHPISPYYSELAFARESQWGKLLKAYHAQA